MIYSKAYIHLILVFLFSKTCFLYAQDVITITGNQSVYPITGKHLEFLEDKEHSYTIEEVVNSTLSGQFTKTDKRRPNFGYSKSRYWVRFNVSSHSLAEPLYLQITAECALHTGSIYYENDQGRWNSSASRCEVELNSEKNYLLHPVMIIPPFTGEKTLYIRFSTEDYVRFDITLHKERELLKLEAKNDTFSIMIIGVFLIILVYAFVQALTLRDKIFLYYLFYVSSFVFAQIVFRRIGIEYLWTNSNWWNYHANSLALLFVLLASVQYARTFINSAHYTPVLDKIFKIIIGVYLLMIPMSFFLSWSNVIVGYYIVMYPAFLLIFVSGIIALRKGNSSMIFFFAAISMVIISAIMVDLCLNGVIDSYFIIYHLLDVAIIAEFILLAIGASRQMRMLKNEAEISRTQILEKEHALSYTRTKLKKTRAEIKVLSKKKKAGETEQLPENYYHDPLTEKELEVLHLVAQGLSNVQIAEKLFVSVNTIKTHVQKIYAKLNVKKRMEAVDVARKLGIID